MVVKGVVVTHFIARDSSCCVGVMAASLVRDGGPFLIDITVDVSSGSVVVAVTGGDGITTYAVKVVVPVDSLASGTNGGYSGPPVGSEWEESDSSYCPSMGEHATELYTPSDAMSYSDWGIDIHSVTNEVAAVWGVPLCSSDVYALTDGYETSIR